MAATERQAEAVRLTKRAVDGAEPRAASYRLWDRDLAGFGLKVMPSGVKTYVAWYRIGTGRKAPRREYTIGRHGTLTAEQARAEAERVISAARLGGDPQADRKRGRAEITVSELCERYFQEACGRKKPSTIYIDRGRVRRHVEPLLGKRLLSDVGRSDIERFVRDVTAGRTAVVEKTGPRGKAVVKGGGGTAARALGLLGAIFEFAVVAGLKQDNPVRGVDRARDRARDRFLNEEEWAALGTGLQKAAAAGVNPMAIEMVQLLALTGCRRGEIAALVWSEVDLQHRCLRLGDSKTGAKIVPLGEAAAELISSFARSPSIFVFPSASDPKRPFAGLPKAWLTIRTLAGLPDLRLHDLRHSFASAGLASGQSLPLLARLLGHARVATTERYAHLADAPVQRAADTIARKLADALEGKAAAPANAPRQPQPRRQSRVRR